MLKKKSRTQSQSGQGLIEYIILVALIALVSVVATENLGKKVKAKMTEIKESFDSRVVVRGGADGDKKNDLGELRDLAGSIL